MAGEEATKPSGCPVMRGDGKGGAGAGLMGYFGRHKAGEEARLTESGGLAVRGSLPVGSAHWLAWCSQAAAGQGGASACPVMCKRGAAAVAPAEEQVDPRNQMPAGSQVCAVHLRPLLCGACILSWLAAGPVARPEK